jgi:23S rRNA (guanine745-N1)-methyltransferase
VNKRGYVTLLGSGSKLIGDTAEMLDARDAVLEAGTFSAVAHAVAEGATGPRILDAGSGTGHYLRKTLDAHPDAFGLAMDLSPTAVARAVRSSPRIRGLVADTWRSLPVRTAAVDTVLNVFAPRNLPEFHRVIRADGTLVVVVPRADHLAELREDAGMLDIPADKAASVISAAEPLFALVTDEHIAAPLELDPALAAALVGMGPSARHGGTVSPKVAQTTLSVDVLRFRRRAASS